MFHSYCRFVQAFENATIALVTQINFTNLTVTTEDVGLFAERVGVALCTWVFYFGVIFVSQS